MADNAIDKTDPRYTVIVVGEDGRLYKLTGDKWMTDDNVVFDPKKPDAAAAGGQGVINQLNTFGAYLSYVPPEIAVGIGSFCTVVNLRAILKNNPPSQDGSKK